MLITELFIPDKNDEDFDDSFKNVLYSIEFITKTNNFEHHQFDFLKVILLINTNKHKNNSCLFQELDSYLNHFRLSSVKILS